MSSGETILRLEKLTKHFPVKRGIIFQREIATLKAVDDVSFEIKAGQTLGLVGESGCGKSTLARCIVRLLDPTSGRIEFEGQDISRLSGKALRSVRRDLVMIFQDPMSSLNPRMRVSEIIGEPLEVYRVGTSATRRARVMELLELVGLNSEHFNRFPHEFSGGQRQRIGIARALALSPKLIVCDEPVSALDVSVQAQIINLLEDLQAEFGLTYLFIAHDLDIVRRVSDEVHVMYLGRVVERGTDEDLYEAPHHPYSAALLSARPVADPDQAQNRARIVLEGDVPSPLDLPSGCRFRTRCPRAQPACSEVEPELEGPVGIHEWACHYPVETWPLASPEDIRRPGAALGVAEVGP
ncbi:MAG: dipeptide ABC transporter ATP-binding protein [Acidimicrobiia bacterium]|nr:dipeptide ABC transporter ATP-binding protein [Acidimicrobiia bacterium]